MRLYSTMNVPSMSSKQSARLVFVATKGAMAGRYFDRDTIAGRRSDERKIEFSFGFPLPYLSIGRENADASDINAGWKEYITTIDGEKDKKLGGGYCDRNAAISQGYKDGTLPE